MSRIRVKDGDIAAVEGMVIELYQELERRDSGSELLGCATLNDKGNEIRFTQQFFRRYNLHESKIDNFRMLSACYGYHKDLASAVA